MSSKAGLLAKLEGASQREAYGVLESAPTGLKGDKEFALAALKAVGDYAGGELFVEGEPIDIRYAPARFNGWKQRHWTSAFEGERFSLVWFTPLGCEFGSGLALARSYATAG